MGAKIRCLACKDIIVSRSVHDFRTCKCGETSVDGGNTYLRVVGDNWDVEEPYEYKDYRHER